MVAYNIGNKSFSQDSILNSYEESNNMDSTKNKRAQFKRTESYYGKSSKKSEIKISSMSLRNNSNMKSKNREEKDKSFDEFYSQSTKEDSKKNKKAKSKSKNKSDAEKKKKHGRKGSKDNISLEESNLGDMVVGLNFDDISFSENEKQDEPEPLSSRQEKQLKHFTHSKSSSNIDKMKVKNSKNVFEIISRLGKGSYGTVWCGILNDKKVALKQIDFSNLSEKKGISLRRQIKREVNILKNLQDENIIRYDGLYYNKLKKEISVVMELVEGVSLTEITLFAGKLGEDVSACLIKQVLKGLSYIHENNLIHRDIKPDNILINANSKIKIIDFGTVALDSNEWKRRSAVGTPWYCAPEVINTEDYNWSVDIWSLGCMILELITGKPPYDDLNSIQCLMKMATSPPPIPQDLSSECHDFISKCLAVNKSERPTAKELLNHSYILKYEDKEQNILSYLQSIIEDILDNKEED